MYFQFYIQISKPFERIDMAYYTKNKNPLYKFISLLYNHKFSILFFVFLLYVAFKPNDFVFSGSILLNIVAILFVLNIVARVKVRIVRVILNILFIFLIFISAFFSICYSDWIWTEATLAILRTDAAEATEMTTAFILPGLITLAITITLILLAEKELRKHKPIPVVISLIK